MQTEILTPNDNFDLLDKAAEIIKNGGLVVFPTETVYGLGADATNPIAAKKIYDAKGRPSDNPLIIHIHTPEDAEKYAFTTPLYYLLAQRFMPGPLTVVLQAKDTVPTQTRAGLPTVAVRCPINKIARELIKRAEVPIAAPSANLSGSPSATTYQHVLDDMYGRVDMIINGNDSDIGVESTIVKIDSDNSLTLLRPGKITYEELLEVCDNITVSSAVVAKLKENEVAISPGMKYRHYAPKTPLLLIDAKPLETAEYIKSENITNIGIIAYEEDVSLFERLLPYAKVFSFGKKDDQLSHARLLFSLLRDSDKYNFSKIYAPLPNKSGVGLAIYNRLIRAAAHEIVKL